MRPMVSADDVALDCTVYSKMSVSIAGCRVGNTSGHTDIISLLPAGVLFGKLTFPVLLINLLLSLSAQIPNNAYMEDMRLSDRETASIERSNNSYPFIATSLSAPSCICCQAPGVSGPTLRVQPWLGFRPLRRGHCHHFQVRLRASHRRGQDRRRLLQVDELRRGAASCNVPRSAALFEGEADLKYIKGKLISARMACATNATP